MIKSRSIMLLTSTILFINLLGVSFGMDIPPNFQGRIQGYEPEEGYLIVNERKVLMDGNVEIKDKEGGEASLKDLKIGQWIYIKGKFDDAGKVVAKRIYLLPKYIIRGERSDYPFMNDRKK